MSDNFENVNSFILDGGLSHSANDERFALQTEIFPVIHNTNVTKLNAVCRASKTNKTLFLIAIIAIFWDW